MVVAGTVPPPWINVREGPNPLPEVIETSKLTGAVTRILSIRLEPETVND